MDDPHADKNVRGPEAVAIREVLPPEAISEQAHTVLRRLAEAGHSARLVGGGVRDLLLGREPKDFDVVTDALPDEIRRVFRNARLIGRRFRLAHIHFGRTIIEVATYRGTPKPATDEGGPDENVFGTEEEDAWRRDFTINALYYEVKQRRLYDYVGGLEDLKRGILRTIGEPRVRFNEDPVRMLRAVRFAAKLGFRVDPEAEACLPELADLLAEVSPARLFEEVLKLFQGGYALETYELLRHYGLFRPLFPLTEEALRTEEGHFPKMLLPRALENTDARVRTAKPITPAFLFAALLWGPVQQELKAHPPHGSDGGQAIQQAADRVLREQLKRVMIPKRFSGPAREIWGLQSRFDRRSGRQAFRFLEHKRFRAAYDFLLLRAECGEEEPALAEWWSRFQEAGAEAREEMVKVLGPAPAKRPRRRRRPAVSHAP
ncbi:MAG: polynucleotide adenylyltransferase PcnB [Acidiferrobacteraceae bacterium]